MTFKERQDQAINTFEWLILYGASCIMLNEYIGAWFPPIVGGHMLFVEACALCIYTLWKSRRKRSNPKGLLTE